MITYDLEEVINGGTPQVVRYRDANLTQVDKAISLSGAYQYRVRVCDYGICGGYSSPVSVGVNFSPPAPSALSILPGDEDGYFQLNWQAPSGELTGYRLEQIINGGDPTYIELDKSLTSKDMLAQIGGSYQYRIQACYSTECSEFTSSLNINTDAAVPGIPLIEIVRGEEPRSFSLNWTATGARFELQTKQGSGDWRDKVLADSADTTKTFTSMMIGDYDYRVRACNTDVCSDYSVAVSASVPGNSNINLHGVSPGRMAVSWTTVSGPIQKYVVSQWWTHTNAWKQIYAGQSTQKTVTLDEVNEYRFQVQVCTAQACSYPKSSVLVTYADTQGPQPPTPPDGGGDPDSEGDSDSGVGAIGGSHSVGNDGSAAYSIPISLPAGTAGIQPDLQLSYNSNGGNGLLGTGWSLSGLSAITRCPTNLEDHGIIDGVDLDDNDQLCLNGVRLIEDGSYDGGTLYRTQLESFSRVVGYGSVGTSHDRFKVWTAGGQILEYGFTADSQVETEDGNNIFEWLINKTADRYDNYLTYVYDKDILEGEYQISEINYTYNGTAGANAEHRVEFTYSTDRSDPMVGYISGTKRAVNDRLEAINVYSGSTLLHSYKLYFEISPNTRQSRLQSLEHCNGLGDCLPSTQFEYIDRGAEGEFVLSSGFTPSSEYGIGSNNYRFEYGDFNGDGRTDMIHFPNDGISHVWLANGDGTFTVNDFKPDANYNFEGDGGYRYRTGDFNGDGLSDLIHFVSNDHVNIWTSNGDGTFAVRYQFTPWQGYTIGDVGEFRYHQGDFNGDGLSDLIHFPAGNTSHIWLANSAGDFTVSSFTPSQSYDIAGSGNYKYQTGDFNGDGLTDLIHFYGNNQTRLWLSDGDGDFTVKPFDPSSDTDVGTYDLAANEYRYQTADFNGDGLTDLIHFASDQNVRIWIGKGDGRFDIQPAYQPWSGYAIGGGNNYHYQAGDYNGDGLTDLVHFKDSTSINLWQSLGDGTFIVKGFTPDRAGVSPQAPGYDGNPTNYDISSNHYQYGASDFNGDGKSDFIHFYSNDEVVLWQPTTGIPDLLEKVTNGFGVETGFNYLPLTDDNGAVGDRVYEKGTGAQYPATDIQNAQYVVSKLTMSNGIGGTNSTSYQYKGLKIHLRGLGSLGFEQMTTTNNDTQISTEVTFDQNYNQRLQSTPKKVITRTQNGVVLSDTRNTWQLATWGSGSDRRYQPQLAETLVTKRDLNGAFLHSEESDYQNYDDEGNLTLMETVVKDQSGSILRTTRTDNTYQPADTQQWLFNLLQRTRVETHVSGRPMRAKVSSWSYDPITGRKTSEQIRHPSTDAVLHNTLYGGAGNQVDSFGNHLAITVDGPDFVSRTSTVQYTANGRNVKKNINALNHSNSHSYYSFNDLGGGAYPGKLKTTTDANGLVTQYKYDGWGRATDVTVALGTSGEITTRTRMRRCDGSCPANGEYYIVKQTDGGANSQTFIDALGRELRKGQLAAQDSSSDYLYSYIDYRYDSQGRNVGVSEPYFDDSSASHWNNFTYDQLSRVTRTVSANNQIDEVDFNGLIVTSTRDIGGESQQKVLQKNALGELLTSTDNDGQMINYGYDSHGNMTRITDPASNQTQIGYDVLGRKISMQDPDKGNWTYYYNGLGQLITQTDANQKTTCNVYDVGGRLTKRIDGYAGSHSNQIGQASDATNQCANDGGNLETAWWYYDGDRKGALDLLQGKNGYQESYSYDSLGRVEETIKTVNGASYQTGISYDEYSRPLTTTYPGIGDRLQVKNTYNGLGRLISLSNAANDELYYQARTFDARGNVTDELYGNGVHTERSYQPATGRLSTIKSYSVNGGLTADIQNLRYTFDTLGNLDYREDYLNHFREDFEYDSLNRLITTTANFAQGIHSDIQTTSVSYDELGNITQKTGVGSYSYGNQCSVGAGPHAVCAISGAEAGDKNTSYRYDNNGNMTSGDGRTINYTLFGKPERIVKSGITTEIAYGPDRNRYYRKDSSSDLITEYTYVGGVYEKVEISGHANAQDNRTEERHFIGGVAILTIENRSESAPGESLLRFLHKDHLGSITSITNNTGQLVESFSFDAWGKRRAPSLAQLEAQLDRDWSSLTDIERRNLSIGPLALSSNITNKGFTGHEQMDGVGLIHMNGRVYDADIGRFLSADPFVKDSTNLQALNRYSYVENNPLSYTDPSGYFLKGLLSKVAKAFGKVLQGVGNLVTGALRGIGRVLGKVPWLSTVVGGVMCGFTGPAAVSCWATFGKVMAGLNAAITLANGGTIGSALGGMAVGFIASGVPGGSGWWKSGLTGSFSRSLIRQGASKIAGNIAGGLLASGVAAKASGGKFVDGVKGAAVGVAIRWIMIEQERSKIVFDGPLIAGGCDTEEECRATFGNAYFDELSKSKMPSGSSLTGAGATGADIAAAIAGCIAGACPGAKVTDSLLLSNTAPIRLVAKSVGVLSVSVEAYEFNDARLRGDGLGMLDATVDTGAMLPAFVFGGPGVVFSMSYAISDNWLSPILVPPIVNMACAISGKC
ncbi:FG-GAP-like repeat-containing protein [Motiliproteus sp. MSK22-1]|uniref:FG-GAP-like repeat-containing protein n=1 Tax=Motiliproteus sp. MSK22-1 TaxID=1897630 RepID=UPI0009787D38|nr:FG-GAP-like repeat-containing protein [Motiliproteus sp. MSK22-1]OMH30405.1 hypothetical protein BGP75_18690 [Motiliproteus sp. MSK22-1]